jgi:glyoxylase-like metal-dependent hydrolase (beta-lactamase superfamily II)
MISNLAAAVQAFTSNVFLVEGERTVLVDPGANFDVVSAVDSRVSDLDAVVLTHTHADHVGNLPAVKDAFGVDAWGFDPEQDGIDHRIEDEERVVLGDHTYTALHTPGHKDDHLCLYSAAARCCFAGDLIFQNGGFGRTDLEEGDRATLIQSIERLLDVVDSDVEVIHVGHGPSITDHPRRQIELAARTARSF